MDPIKRAEVMAKLEKILAKADSSRNPSQAEVETAMRLAQKIANENNLDIAAVMAAKKPEDKTPSMEVKRADCCYRAGSQKIEHEFIFRVLRTCFDIEVVRLGKIGFVIIGEITDVQISQFCFAFLESMFSKLCRQYARSRGYSNYGPAVLKASFYTGLELGIIEANLRVKKEAEAATSFALVLVDKKALVTHRMHQEFPNLRQGKPVHRPRDSEAEYAGLAKGRTIKLNHQLT